MIVFGLKVSDTPPLVKKIQQLEDIEYNMDRHELGDSLEWETVPSGPVSLFHYPDPTFDLRYLLVGTFQVDHRATWNGFNQGLERREFTVGMHRRDMETKLEIVLVHLVESLTYLRNGSVREVVDSCETYLATKFQGERNIVHKKDVGCHKNLFVELQQLLRNLHIVPRHRICLAPSGLPFKRGNFLAPNLQSNIDVLDSHGTVLDLVTANHPLEVRHGRVTQCLVQSSCEFCTLDFTLS
jgi:hypothetical protein